MSIFPSVTSVIRRAVSTMLCERAFNLCTVKPFSAALADASAVFSAGIGADQ